MNIQISFKNFKIFKEFQTLELRPITILFGKNNTGKTAVAKLPTLIKGSLSGRFAAPVLLENDAIKIGISYDDLFYNRNMILEPLLFKLQQESKETEISISGNHRNQIFISRYVANGTELNLKKSKFRGFIPQGEPQWAQPFPFEIDYIDAFRKFPEAYLNNVDNEITKIGSTGENAYKLITQYYLEQKPVLRELQSWFRDNFEGWEIGVKEVLGASTSYEIILSAGNLKPINIVNTGSGIRQTFPLVVRSFMPVEEPTLIIIEEPETHLHPAAHGNLAQRFADSYLQDNRRYYLMESHSQNFILRFRRMIAEKKLKPKDLALYYVDYDEEEEASTMRLIEVDEDGGLPNDDWPEGVFQETSKEIKSILMAQSKK